MAIDETFVAAVAKTIRDIKSHAEVRQFANHLLQGKLVSKQWLVNTLRAKGPAYPQKTLILGSWYPTYIPYCLSGHFTCVDIDPSIVETSKLFVNNLYGSESRFEFITADARSFTQASRVDYDLVINTSCEHMPYDMKQVVWNEKCVYAFQSNNYDIPEHVNWKKSLSDFVSSTGLNNIIYSGLLSTANYDRYMVVGKIN